MLLVSIMKYQIFNAYYIVKYSPELKLSLIFFYGFSIPTLFGMNSIVAIVKPIVLLFC